MLNNHSAARIRFIAVCVLWGPIQAQHNRLRLRQPTEVGLIHCVHCSGLQANFDKILRFDPAVSQRVISSHGEPQAFRRAKLTGWSLP